MKSLYDYLVESSQTAEPQIEKAISAKRNFCVEGPEENAVNLINKIAKKLGYKQTKVIYLDKAESGDLSGVPFADKNGKAQTAMPAWINELNDSKDEQVLIFTGTPDNKVANELMPIALDHKIGDTEIKNIACVAIVGNKLDWMSKPLESRFGKPIK